MYNDATFSYSVFTKYAEQLEVEGVTIELVKEIINEHLQLRERALDRYGRYQQFTNSTPILTRNFDGEAAKKINNKLANDYFGEIIDTKVGYMFGLPISVMYDKKAPRYDVAYQTIERFKKVNNFDDFNAEIGKFAAMCGYDVGLCYIDKDGQERVMRVDPWESIIISKTEINEPEFGIRYFETWDEKNRVEVYTDTERYIFEDEELMEQKPHLFDHCPMFGVPNNAELQGDADKVLTLIDAYDRSLSDMNNEIEQYRLAYMIFVGYEPDEDVLADMIKTGALYIPEAENGEKIDWLVKQLDPSYVDSHLDRVEANITRFAKHVNFTDAAFGSDITGPAMRYKLFALETKAKYFERKHEAAMLYMFKVLASSWEKKGIAIDYTLLDLKYTRNIPVNIVDEANAAAVLSSITSKRTALSTLSFVTDVDEEMDQIHQEAEESINLDNVPPSDPNADPKTDPNTDPNFNEAG